jgi:excisionase family DNA binding protein
MVPFDLLAARHPGVILEGCVTAEAAADLTGYNIQHIRRLALAGKLEAIHVGRSWLIKISSIETYLQDVVEVGDARFGPRVPAQLNIHDNASA